MSEADSRKRTILIVAVSIFIVLALAVAAVPFVAMWRNDGGVKTGGINTDRLSAASTGVDGNWEVITKPGPNSTSAGFTFDEVLPGQRKTTSGSTQAVSGSATIEAGTLTAGEITIDMATLTSDSDARDSHTRETILHTAQYPTATFVVTQPVDVSGVPDDGSVAEVELTGDLTIHGATQQITETFAAARSGDRIIVAADIPINRLDYGVKTPELVAAKIAEDGEINVRINMAKR